MEKTSTISDPNERVTYKKSNNKIMKKSTSTVSCRTPMFRNIDTEQDSLRKTDKDEIQYKTKVQLINSTVRIAQNNLLWEEVAH